MLQKKNQTDSLNWVGNVPVTRLTKVFFSLSIFTCTLTGLQWIEILVLSKLVMLDRLAQLSMYYLTSLMFLDALTLIQVNVTAKMEIKLTAVHEPLAKYYQLSCLLGRWWRKWRKIGMWLADLNSIKFYFQVRNRNILFLVLR